MGKVFSWMDGKDLQESIKNFAKKQGDIKYLEIKNTINILLINEN